MKKKIDIHSKDVLGMENPASQLRHVRKGSRTWLFIVFIIAFIVFIVGVIESVFS